MEMDSVTIGEDHETNIDDGEEMRGGEEFE
jgi:hypothetical protein